ncbi:MAG: YceH family protein [Xanthomonadales bacterium]
MQEMTEIQVRVLGCLVEKKETTPDQYPLTLNALRNACNQKTARHPVTSYTVGEIGHALRELQSLDCVHEAWGNRAAKYEHLAEKALGLHSKGLSLLCPLMLRGPQTPGELKTNSHRLYAFNDLDDVHYILERLCQHEPPLVTVLPRQPGQKEERYAHLLSGEPDIPAYVAVAAGAAQSGLAARVETLELELEKLRDRLERIEAGST